MVSLLHYISCKYSGVIPLIILYISGVLSLYVELNLPYTRCNALSELLTTLVNGHTFWLLLRIQAPLSLFYIDEVALDMYIITLPL